MHHHRYLLRALVIAGLLAAIANLAPRINAQPAIQIVIDIHCDPITKVDLTDQRNEYLDWIGNNNWALTTAAPHGAKLSFLSDGSFMEWVADTSILGNPGEAQIQAFIASGESIGVHSHKHNRDGPHSWLNPVGFSPPGDEDDPVYYEQHWIDHLDATETVLTSLGYVDPNKVNKVRGGGIPNTEADSLAIRFGLMSDNGFEIFELGEDQIFYAYFNHWVMNPWRPDTSHLLSEDPMGDIMIVPGATTLGYNDLHFGIVQFSDMEYLQANFLLVLLNWLSEVHVLPTDRVFTYGWGSHCHEYGLEPGGAPMPTRADFDLMLAWLAAHFEGEMVGGEPVAAQWASYVDVHDEFLAWETANPGASSFNYPVDVEDWSQYPYLVPAAQYLTEAVYQTVMPDRGPIRWHEVEARPGLGSFTFYVAYSDDGVPRASVDLSLDLGLIPLHSIDPASGTTSPTMSDSVPIAAHGAILVAPTDAITLCSGPADPDFPDLGDSCSSGLGECTVSGGMRVCRADMLGTECDAVPGDPSPDICDGLDNDCDGVADNQLPDIDPLVQWDTHDDMTWLAVPLATEYDVVAGDLATLKTTGNFFTSVDSCVGDDVSTSIELLSTPAEGAVFWYLTRPANCAGNGSYGTTVRDVEIGASGFDCS